MKKVFSLVLILAGFLAKAQFQVCAGGSTTLTAPNPASLTIQTYSMNPGGFTSPNGIFVVSPTITTNFTLFAIGTNSANVAATACIVSTVTVFAQPVVNLTFTQTTCTSTMNAFNFNLSFSPNNLNPTYTVTWALDPNNVPVIPPGILTAQQTSVTGGITPGPYAATITSQGGCTTSVAFTINSIPLQANFTLFPNASVYSITCTNPTINVTASNPAFTYTWSGNTIGTVNSSSLDLTGATAGSIVIAATNPASNCTNTKTISVVINTSTPQSNVTPTTQNITCTLSSITTVSLYAITPSVNITHIIYPPQGGAFTANSATAPYFPGGTGTYTYELLDNTNGCKAVKYFTVTSSSGFAAASIVSPQDFTVGCSTKSLCTISVSGVTTSPSPGAPVSYTFLAPGGSSVLPSGPLGSVSSTAVSVPGTWTVVVKDNSNLCETRIPISIIQNTFGPSLDTVYIPYRILTCDSSKVKLEAYSETPNISYNWSFPFPPGNLGTSTITVNSLTNTPSATLVATYTITLTDNSNKCITTSTVPIYQNLYKPNVAISANGTLTCKTQTVTLTNQSSSSIPLNNQVIPPPSNVVQGFIWQGPSPQNTVYISSTYIGQTEGVYTLTAKDLNNGCTNTGTLNLPSNKLVPSFTFSGTPVIDCGAEGTNILANLSPSIASPAFTWTPPSATLATNTRTLQNVLATGSGMWKVLVLDNINGCTKTDSLKIEKGKLIGQVSVNKTFGYTPLTVNFVNNSYSGVSSTTNIVTAWNLANGTGSVTMQSSVNVATTYSNPGTYKVMAIVNKKECLDTVRITIKVESKSKLQVPNVFSPNGDKVNDLFFLQTTNLSNISFKIFDRWGHSVYEAESETGNIEWDGNNQAGKECPEGTYFYTIKALGADGEEYDQKGTISLVR